MVALLAQSAWAQRIPHEFFSYSGAANGSPTASDLPEPGRAAAAPRLGGAVFGPNGPLLPQTPGRPADQNGPMDEQEPLRLDADTGGEGELPYAVVYRPSIAPHKRSGARDLAQWDSSGAWLGVRDPARQPVALTPQVTPGFTTYEGTLTVRARSNVPVPLPSVAPDMYVHEVRAQPAVPIVLTRDGTDLYYVSLPVDGEVQLRFTVSVDPLYAAGGLDGLTPSRREASQVPPAFAAQAQAVIDAIGVPDTATDVEAVALLVAWFGAFNAAPPPDPPPPQADLYRTLSLARAGVCRHRAQAFVLTAAALGIPARYVHNEAHAFVEVEFREGWRRFDLGGDAAGLDLIGAPEDDDAPRSDELGGAEEPGGSPPEPAGQPDGTTQHHAPPAPESTDATATTSPTGSQAAPGEAGEPGEPGEVEQTDGAPAPLQGAPPAVPTSHYGAEGMALAPSDAPRLASAVRVSLGERRRYRREPVTVRGRLSGASGEGIEDQAVVLLLRDAAGNEAPLGEVRTGADGAFVVVLPIPGAVPVGSWQVVARFEGSARWEGTASVP